ncbi:UNVERIFIED_CONTAM: hypothetical protein Slati_2677000 [Sesamum latifolium]|uniref:Uncharacterized protein n=1 Tax=Sesamum latifolium TaxID=2727402 RepID=A0AAW2VZI3_9LAMI
MPQHNDALVISATVSNFWVKKVLVDTGSAADILFFTAFSQMGIGTKMLRKVNTPLVGFNGSVVEPMGEIALPISIGTTPYRATRMLKFLVVDAPSSYNIIIGRPSLNSFRAVVSTVHMKLKFPAYREIGEEKGDCRLAKECHANILKNKRLSLPTEKEIQISKKEEKRTKITHDCPLPPLEQSEQQVTKKRLEEEKLAVAEEIKNVQIIEGEPKKFTSIGTAMGQKIEEELVHFLRTNSDVFAWSVHDLTGIDLRVMMHKLNVDPNSRPVRQKKRTLGQERNEIIKEEVEKLLTAGYIRPVQYPEWLANIVLVPKPNKKWRMCIDFTDLNRTYPKYSYPSQESMRWWTPLRDAR